MSVTDEIGSCGLNSQISSQSEISEDSEVFEICNDRRICGISESNACSW